VVLQGRETRTDNSGHRGVVQVQIREPMHDQSGRRVRLTSLPRQKCSLQSKSVPHLHHRQPSVSSDPLEVILTDLVKHRVASPGDCEKIIIAKSHWFE